MKALVAPFPWFGGKRRVAPEVWARFGDVPNYVEPFFGSGAVLFGRPGGAGKIETVNDKDCFVANVWRAIQHDPEATRKHADWPVNEADLHARHQWLVKRRETLREQLYADPAFYDAQVAGWWIWGLSAWIGNGWCTRDERVHEDPEARLRPGTRPDLSSAGRGVHSMAAGKKPRTHRGIGLHATGLPPNIFETLQGRLRHVRVVCGEWTRVVGLSTLGLDTNEVTGPKGKTWGMTPCGVFLDPPYAHRLRSKRLYHEDDQGLSDQVREWCIQHGEDPRLRIALCGLQGEHDMPSGWSEAAWKSQSGWETSARERIWFSPHCLRTGRTEPLFQNL